MSRGLALCFLLLSPTAAEDELKIPIEVDQQGKQIYFVTDATSDVFVEAAKFCAAHLRGMPANECRQKLVAEVEGVRKQRREAALSMPALTFTVQDPHGDTQRFFHEEYADPAEESRAFCRKHFDFPEVDESACVEAMLQNAQRALEEIRARDKVEL